jgi:hypothetical protein
MVKAFIQMGNMGDPQDLPIFGPLGSQRTRLSLEPMLGLRPQWIDQPSNDCKKGYHAFCLITWTAVTLLRRSTEDVNHASFWIFLVTHSLRFGQSEI